MHTLSPNQRIESEKLNENFTEATDGTGSYCAVAFLARRTTDQTGIVTSTNTLIQCATEVFDIGSNYSTSTYQFTAPYDGVYHFEMEVQIDAVGSNSFGMLFLDGATVVASDVRYANAVTDDMSAGCSITIQMTAGQTMEARGAHNAGANRTFLGSLTGRNWFSGFLVGRT